MTSDLQKLFLQRAEESRTTLNQKTYYPLAEVVPRVNSTAFQGWSLDPVEKSAWASTQGWNKSASFILDFGEHIVGHFTFSVVLEGTVDAPVQLRFVFGEVPSEVCEPLEPFKGGLSRGWLQDETLTVMEAKTRTFERRLAFRYVKVEIASPSWHYRVRLTDFSCKATTSADYARLLPYRGPEEFRDIDAIALRTLANCMQDVFEDGPKRDRRLWLGDLRLMALANEVTFQDYRLSRRCLYLLAAYAPEDNLMPSDVYVYPQASKGASTIFDYALLFAPTLLEYAKASGDLEAARELWPIAKRQVDLVLNRHFDTEGLFVDPGTYWLFIDWREKLHKHVAIQGVTLYALSKLIELADLLGTQAEIPDAGDWKKKIAACAREKLRDAQTGFFVSGPEKQLSWASNIWMILSGAVSPEEGARLLTGLSARKEAVLPAGPYLYHYMVDAMLHCGMKEEALELMQRYWGGMVKKGASTFWEVYDPENDFLSPYKDYHINSYCHAWSCTPSYFLRKFW